MKWNANLFCICMRVQSTYTVTLKVNSENAFALKSQKFQLMNAFQEASRSRTYSSSVIFFELGKYFHFAGWRLPLLRQVHGRLLHLINTYSSLLPHNYRSWKRKPHVVHFNGWSASRMFSFKLEKAGNHRSLTCKVRAVYISHWPRNAILESRHVLCVYAGINRHKFCENTHAVYNCYYSVRATCVTVIAQLSCLLSVDNKSRALEMSLTYLASPSRVPTCIQN